MAWLTTGPDFVLTPRNPRFRRLSRRNAHGMQGVPVAIAVDPNEPTTIYTVERPSTGGTSAFRSRDSGRTWTNISDPLRRLDPNADAQSIVPHPHPAQAGVVFLSSLFRRRIYLSTDRGNSWQLLGPLPGFTRSVWVEPGGAGDLRVTVVYAVTDQGLFRSVDGGATWGTGAVLPGNVFSFSAHVPTSGPQHYYAAVLGVGVFHANDPTSMTTDPAAPGWFNLNSVGLPYSPAVGTQPETWTWAVVDACARAPNRAYAYLARPGRIAVGLYTTNEPRRAWSLVTATPPTPDLDEYALTFAVAPHSPGDGQRDVLLFGAIGFFRSIDGGRTWQDTAARFHADVHAVAFAPPAPAADQVPVTYLGCDGGIASSSKVADRAVDVVTTPPHFNEDVVVEDTAVWQNLNRGRASSAIIRYAADPAIGALGWIACQDTGLGAGAASLGWRGLSDADVYHVAAAATDVGVAVWWNAGAWWRDWPSFRVTSATDRGGFGLEDVREPVVSSGSRLRPMSNFVAVDGPACLVGVQQRTMLTSIAVAVVGSPQDQLVTPASMDGIQPGSVLIVDDEPGRDAPVTPSDPEPETIVVNGVTPTQFRARLTKNHAASRPIFRESGFVARCDARGAAMQISPNVEMNGRYVLALGAARNEPSTVYAATAIGRGTDQRLFLTRSATTADATMPWTEITAGRPPNPQVTAIAVHPRGRAFVLLATPATSSGAGGSITTPLYEIVNDTWVPQECDALPSDRDAAGMPIPFGGLVTDPRVPAGSDHPALYATQGGRAFRLSYQFVAGPTRGYDAWVWTDISEGLPGEWIYDLWCGTVGPAEPRPFVLRAVGPRGGWELEPDLVSTPPVRLVVRDNILDHAAFPISPGAVPNPFAPAEQVWHYQSPDLKVDATQISLAVPPVFFLQTEPEETGRLHHTAFGQLRDRSLHLPTAAPAQVHVQVHNRGAGTASGVQVWVLTCNAAAGLPQLPTNFWEQFRADGTVVPNLAEDSPWRAVGAPQALAPIDSRAPQVASWTWTVPLVPEALLGHLGHHCLVAFVHSAASPVAGRGNSVDALVPGNKQIAQKNLHIGHPLLSGSGSAGDGSGDAGGDAGGPRGLPAMTEYVEFHNPTSEERDATLVFDLRALPAELQISFQLANVTTVGALDEALVGIQRTRNASADDPPVSDRFSTLVHEVVPGARAEVRGVRLPPGGWCAAFMTVRSTGWLSPGAQFRFEVQQVSARWEDELGYSTDLVGGSTFVVQIAGEPPRATPSSTPHDEGEVEVDILPYMPPWVSGYVEQQQVASGKREAPPERGFSPIRRLHQATPGSVVSNWTYLDATWPSHGNPHALILASHCRSGGGAPGPDRHPIGTWYDDGQQRWAIYNQDRAPMPESTFSVAVVDAPGAFVHRADAGNTVENSTYLTHPGCNGEPDALLLATPCYNPGGGEGVYLPRAFGTWYDRARGQWALFTEDRTPMPTGCAFVVLALAAGTTEAFVHVTKAPAEGTARSYLDHASFNDRPDQTPIVTACWDTLGRGGVYVESAVGLAYDEELGRWAIETLDAGGIPDGASFVVA